RCAEWGRSQPAPASGDRTRRDVLVDAEEVVGIVVALERGQPFVLGGAIGLADAFVALVTEEVDIYPAGVRLQRRGVAASPCDVRLIVAGVRPDRVDVDHVQRIAMTVRGRVLADA